MEPIPHSAITEAILGAAFEVANTLGPGFLEKVYERALSREFHLRGIRAVSQASFPVVYKTHLVGEYHADFLVEDEVIVEIKAVPQLAPEHTSQCINYLNASGRKVCLLVNFDRPRLQWRRILAPNALARLAHG